MGRIVNKIILPDNQIIHIDRKGFKKVESNYIEVDKNYNSYYLKFNDFEETTLQISNQGVWELGESYYTLEASLGDRENFINFLNQTSIEFENDTNRYNLGDLYVIDVSIDNDEEITKEFKNCTIFMGYEDVYIDMNSEEEDYEFGLSITIVDLEN